MARALIVGLVELGSLAIFSAVRRGADGRDRAGALGPLSTAPAPARRVRGRSAPRLWNVPARGDGAMAKILKDVGFVHLHVHSSYSLLEGALKIADLAKLAAADRQPALALTDTDNLFGALEFSEKLAEKGIQPIAGMQLSVQFEAPDPAARVAAGPGGEPRAFGAERGGLRQPDAACEPGLFRRAARRRAAHRRAAPRGARRRSHRADRRAVGTARRRAPARRPARPRRGAARGPERMPSAIGSMSRSSATASMRSGRSRRSCIALADRHGLPLVAANEPFFGRSDDYEAHDALLAIAEGRLVGDENRRRLTPEHHFKTRAQMAELFRDLPDAVQATVEIAMRCAFRVRTAKPFLPRFSRSAEGDALDEARGAAPAGGGGARAAPRRARSGAGPDRRALPRAPRLSRSMSSAG